MGGIDQRTALDQEDDDGRPSFSTLEGLFPQQDGLLARVPGKSLLSTVCSGQIILNICQPFDTSGNILVQTDQNLYAFTLDELLGRAYTPALVSSSGSEDEGMSMAILSDLRLTGISGGPLGLRAVQTLTNSGAVPSNGETVVINGKTYTFQTTLTNVDGNVFKGATGTAAMTNLFHAINASGGTAGVDYAAATIANTSVTATNPTATTVKITAIIPGTVGNAYATTETMVNASWGAATMSGGVDAAADTFYIRNLNTEESDAAGIVSISENGFTLANGTYRIRVTCIWNPVDAGLVAVGTTIGLYDSTGAAFATWGAGVEPILGTPGKSNTGSNTEANNQEIVLEGVFIVAGGPRVYQILQKGSLQAAVRGSSFCGVNDQCTALNVNGVAAKNRYLMVVIWKEP